MVLGTVDDSTITAFLTKCFTYDLAANDDFNRLFDVDWMFFNFMMILFIICIIIFSE